MVTKEQAVAAAARHFAAAIQAQDALALDDAVEAAWWPGGPSRESIRAHLTAVREARARRARGDVVAPLGPLRVDAVRP